MGETSEHDEHVDLDDDNYLEEIDEDAIYGSEDEGDYGTGDEKAEELFEEDSKTSDDGREKSLEADPSLIGDEPGEDEGKHTTSINDIDKEKHNELLSLPPHGSEVFIGGLPKDVSEDELRDLCEPVAKTYEVRLIKNKDTGESKGYAFVAFKTKEDAQKAIEELKNKEFKGRSLRCSLSDTKHRLFIGNIPKSWSEDEFRKGIYEVGPGAENIELKLDALNPGRNRGFAFVDYYNNACADYARKKMSSGSFNLEDISLTVTWADPRNATDSTAGGQVKALYVKNIPEDASPEQLKELFQRHGEVTKVVLPPSKGGQGKGSFGYIHFADRSSALKAVNEKYEVEGQVLEVAIAKPQSDKKTEPASSFGATSNYLSPSQYGFAGNPYGTLGSGYGAAGGYAQQPIIYGRGQSQTPSGMQMVPMVLPDGRIGYVLQQPGQGAQTPPARPRRNERSNGSGGSHGSGDDGSRNRRYRPY